MLVAYTNLLDRVMSLKDLGDNVMNGIETTQIHEMVFHDFTSIYAAHT